LEKLRLGDVALPKPLLAFAPVGDKLLLDPRARVEGCDEFSEFSGIPLRNTSLN
jgi:hypothetical protein